MNKIETICIKNNDITVLQNFNEKNNKIYK